ncbi:MAG: STAS domain-containing protein [Acidimicrobiia bacterium]
MSDEADNVRRLIEGLKCDASVQVVARQLGDDTTVVVAGEIDLATAPRLREVLALADRAANGAGRVFIDLSEVTFMDCAGFAPIAELRERFGEHHENLVIRNPSRRARRLLDLMEMSHLIVPDIDPPSGFVPPGQG